MYTLRKAIISLQEGREGPVYEAIGEGLSEGLLGDSELHQTWLLIPEPPLDGLHKSRLPG